MHGSSMYVAGICEYKHCYVHMCVITVVWKLCALDLCSNKPYLPTLCLEVWNGTYVAGLQSRLQWLFVVGRNGRFHFAWPKNAAPPHSSSHLVVGRHTASQIGMFVNKRECIISVQTHKCTSVSSSDVLVGQMLDKHQYWLVNGCHTQQRFRFK